MTKQSNSQKQTVNVVVNNKMACCEKPKKKRKSKPKPKPRQEEPEMPMDDGFPVLNTPSSSRPSYSAVPIRNTVYMPSTVQISPEGMMPPIPDYFQRPYTNLIRTMEDFQNNIVKEFNDVRQSMNPTIAPQEPRAMPQLSDETMMFDIPPQRPVVTREEARTPMASTMMQNALFEGDEEQPQNTPPVSSLINRFEALTPSQSQSLPSSSQQQDNDTPTRKAQEDERRKFYINSYTDAQIDRIYQNYINKFDIKQRGRRATKKLSQINNILAFEKQHGRMAFDA
jgi:hypothetical protein